MKYRFNKGNYEDMRRSLEDEDWNTLLLGKSVEEQWREREIAKQSKKNPKAFFRYVNVKLKTRSKIADLKTEDGEGISDDTEKACEFNKFFSSVYTREDLHSIPGKLRVTNIKELETIEIGETEVLQTLLKLQPEKSPGPDGIHPRVLKECFGEISHNVVQSVAGGGSVHSVAICLEGS